MVGKSDGTVRVCLDPQYLNSCIKREHLQLPTVEEIAAKLKGAKCFTTLDANKAFWQVELTKDSSELTTFNTPFGRYHFNRLPYGLSSSPEVFHRVFSQIFDGIENVAIYIDDLLIFANNKKELELTTEKVKRAQEYGVKFNKKKCQFGVTRVKYLGHDLTGEGVEVDQTKVKAIKEMRVPENKKELLTFLGTVNYVAKFIPNFAQITSSLRQLTKKDVQFTWSESQQKAFDNLKQKLCKPPVLAYFDVTKPITLSVDASSEGLGCVIFQNNRPIAYGSRALTETEKMYSQIEKECLAIAFGCKKFSQYLFGQKFVVETDHKPLISIFKKPLNKSPIRLQRIRIKLQSFDFVLKHIAGKEIIIADHLSRMYLKETTLEDEKIIEAFVAMIETSVNITDIRLEDIRKKTKVDAQLQEAIRYIRKGWPESKSEVSEGAKPFFSFKDELSENKGLVLKNTCVIIPQCSRSEMVKKVHYTHQGMEKCKALARKSIFWPGMSKQIEDVINNCDICKSYQRANTKEPLIQRELPNEPWEILATDIFFLHGKQYLIVVDMFSKYVEVEELSDLMAESTIGAMKRILSRHGVPKILYSDAGTQFTNYKFEKFANYWSFQHIKVTPKHHQSNGLAERYIQTIKKVFMKIFKEGKDKELALLHYRNTPIDSDGVTPAELLYGRQVRGILPTFEDKRKIERDSFKEVLKKRQERQKQYYDRTARNLKELKVGDVVKVHNENRQLPHKSGIVVALHENPRSYKIKTEQGQIISRNRKALSVGNKFEAQANVYLGESETESQVAGEEGSKVEEEGEREIVNESRDNDKAKQITTRSGRIVNKPSHLQDYVCNIEGS